MAFDIKPSKSSRTQEAKGKQPSQKEAERAEEKILLEEERAYVKGTVAVRDLIAPAAFQVTPRHLVLSGLYVRTIFVVNYPRYVSVGWSAPIINMNHTIDIGMYF